VAGSYSQQWGYWLVDAYAGAWFYTTNPASYAVPLPRPQTEQPIGALEGHLSRNFKYGTWASLDANFWWGRYHEPKRRTESGNQTDGLTYRRDGCVALLQTPVAEDQLQQWHLHSFRWQLSGCASSLAVLLAWLAEDQVALYCGLRLRVRGQVLGNAVHVHMDFKFPITTYRALAVCRLVS
jgi:hypothetical protein